MSSKNNNVIIEINFKTNWNYIRLTKEYIEKILALNSIEDKYINRIAMTVSELLENAVKYSSKDKMKLIIKNNEINNKIEVSVFNIAPKKEALDLIQKIDQLKLEDPFKYFVSKMKESEKRKSGSAGLGLPRIIYEGKATIEGHFHEDENLFEIKTIFILES